MIVRAIQLKDKIVWLVIDQLRRYSTDFKSLDENEEFLCYFKLSEPSSILYGELLRDMEGRPLLFKNVDEAVEKAKGLLNQKL